MQRTPVAFRSPALEPEPIGVGRFERGRERRPERGAGGRNARGSARVMKRSLLCLLAVLAASTSSCKDEPPPPPPPPECGNGLLEAGETCEGLPPPEGCDPNVCTVQMGFACTPEAPASDGDTDGGAVEPMEWMSTCEELDTCGDGIIDAGEDCDDGDVEVMDGCSGCRVDPLYVCMGEPSDCYTCGDGFRNPAEQCDDGELIGMNSPGCENCLVVPGWECFPGQSQTDLCGPVCGDGMWFDTSVPGVTVGFAEGCDDGNMIDGDGCDGSCNVEDGWECDAMAPETSVCTIPGDSTGSDSGGSDSGGSSGGSSGSGGSGSSGSSG